MVVVIICCLFFCPLLALTLATGPNTTTNLSPNRATPPRITVNRSPVLLTEDQQGSLNRTGKPIVPPDSDHLVLDYGDPEAARSSEGMIWAIEWRPDLKLDVRVHQLTIKGWGSLTNFTSLASGIQHIEDLQALHWTNNDPIPDIVLSSVRDFHPQCRMFYKLSFSNWDIYDRHVAQIQRPGEEPNRAVRSKTRRLILGSKNLYGLKAHIEYGDGPNLEDLRLIHEILTTSPNLREVDLSLDHSGCVISDGQPYAFDFSGRSRLAKSALPSLEKIRFSGYALDGPYNGEDEWSFLVHDRDRLRWPWTYLPDVIVKNMPPPWFYSLTKPWEPEPKLPCPTVFNETKNIDGWLERMDFTNLQSLELSRVSPATLHKLRPVLTNLTALAIHWAPECASAAIPSFLENSTRPLRHLDLRNVHFDNLDTFSKMLARVHGSSLRSLIFYNNDESIKDAVTESLSTTADVSTGCSSSHLYLDQSRLNCLQDSSPGISRLEIDMDRSLNASDQHALFEAFGSFHNLSQLTLRLASPTWQARHDANCTRRWDCPELALSDPLVNLTWVKDMFADIRSAQMSRRSGMPAVNSSEPVLTKLAVIVGPWEGRYENSMIGPDKIVSGLFECSLKSAAAAVDDLMDVNREECSGSLTWPYVLMPWDDEVEDQFLYGRHDEI